MSRAVFPAMDGVASTGSSNERARIDHVHPSDSSKASREDIPTKLSDLQNDMTAEDFGALPDTTKYAESAEVGGAAKLTAGIPFGQVDSTSTATAFTATVPGITELVDGVCVFLMNGVVTSASGFTVDINGLGAKPVYSTLAAATRATTLFNINYTLLLVFNSKRVSGGCWDAYYGYDSNTNTIGYQLRTNSMSMPMTSVVYRYRLLFTSADHNHFVPANNSTSTNATASRTVCQDKIDPFGHICYYGTTTSVAAGSRPSASSLWSQYNISLGYSFNRTGAALELTPWKPVYVKCTPQADGSAIIDADTPYVQDLPTTEDGKIYIFLGISPAATAVEILPEHPVYCYRHGKIQLWTGGDWEYQRKPVVVWEVDGTTVTTGLKALQTNIDATMSWQLTGLDLTPYKRIKVYSKGSQGQTNAGTTGAMILEMSLDPRMAIATKGGHYVGSVLSQKPNDANRYASLTCAVSADKTSFAVLRQTSLYGTAATTNNDIGADVVLIEGYYD